MHRTRRLIGLVALTLLVAALAAAVVRGARAADANADRGDGHRLAVVLAPGPSRTRLVVVDLDTGRVARTVALRSLVTDIDVDPHTGIVVAAQTGGIADEADQALSLTDPRTGTVRYVRLPVIDPASVVCLDGRAYALHSVVTSEGLVATVVDVATARVVEAGRVPDGPGIWARAAGSVWTAALDPDGRAQLVRVTPSLGATLVGSPITLPSGMADAGGAVALLGGSGADARTRGPARISLIRDDGRVLASVTATELPYPATMAASAGGVLVVGDWGGQEQETRRLEAFESTTLKPRGAIETSGAVCALAAAGDRVVAVDRTRGRLLILDPASRALVGEIDLGTGELPCADVVFVGPSGPRATP